jgi:F420-0:gamma-glutamyl ligase
LRAGSVIDYILISAGAHGLDGNEIVAQVATVHSDLAADADLFRFQASDHLPISVLIAVGADEDPTGVIQ